MTTLKDIAGNIHVPELKTDVTFQWPVRNEDWKYTPIKSRLPESLLLSNENLPVSANEESWSKTEEAFEICLTNGRLQQPSSFENESLLVCTFDHARKNYTELFEAHYRKLLEKTNEPFAELNAAFATDGIFILVKSNQALSLPIKLRHLLNADASQHFLQSRKLVICETGCEVQLIESYETSGLENFYNAATEVFLAPNARCNYYLLQTGCNNLTAISQIETSIDRDAHFDFCSVTLSGKLLRNAVHATLREPNAGAHLRGLTCVAGEAHVDNHIAINHHAPNCESHQLYKTILSDDATGVFNGKIYVEKDAQKTNAFQSSKAVLLTETATMNIKPQLEIFADDVKCSHGAAIGQVNANELFYLKSRGIDEPSAKNILTFAFAADVIQTITLQPLRQAIVAELERFLNISF
ncbi:MAG: Fe-S cluster assembly protein SufD [Chitinophagales bacterium]